MNSAPDSTNSDHKMMFLTSDICLAYSSTSKVINCMFEPGQGPPGAFLPQVYRNHGQHCRTNYAMNGPEDPHADVLLGFEDLDPTKHFCCAWTADVTAGHTKVFAPHPVFGNQN